MPQPNKIENDVPEISEEELDQLDAEFEQAGIDMADVMKETFQAPVSDDFDFPIDYSDPNKDMGYSNETMQDYTGIKDDFDFPIDYSDPNKDMGYSNERMQDYTGILTDELEGKTRKSEEIGFEHLGEFYPEDLEEDSPVKKGSSVQPSVPQEKKPAPAKQPVAPAPKAVAPKAVPTRREPAIPARSEIKTPPADPVNVPLSKSQTLKVPPAKQETVKTAPAKQDVQVTAPKAEEKLTPLQQQNPIFKKISELRDEINKTGKTWTDSKEFRKFRDALNKSADAIAKRKPGDPAMKPEEMDKMLKDISTAADNYYFAKLGQSHNARRNQRFDIAAQTRDFMQQAREGLQQESKPIEFNNNALERSANKLADKMFYAKSEQDNKALLQGEDHAEFFKQSKDFAKNDATFQRIMSGDYSQFLEFINRDSKEVSAVYQGQDTLRKQAELEAKQAKAPAPEQKKEPAPAPKTQTSPDKEELYQQLAGKMTGALLTSNEETTKFFIGKAGGMDAFQKSLINDLKTTYQGKDTLEFLKEKINDPMSKQLNNYTNARNQAIEKQKQNTNPAVNKNLTKQTQTKQSGFTKE